LNLLRRRVLLRPSFSVAILVALLTLAEPLFAQRDSDATLPVAALGGLMLFFFCAALAAYVYMSLALMTIAQKTGAENAWFAWIPILNILLMLNIARKPIWWIILFLIPLVNIVVAILVWMGIAEARNKPNWWGIMVIVPVMNIVMPGYLAWSD
jgi:hypothetical protein